jgi:hypothetical protein
MAGDRAPSPQEARTYAGWADDLTTIADALGHREFGVTGWPEGGPGQKFEKRFRDFEPADRASRHINITGLLEGSAMTKGEFSKNPSQQSFGGRLIHWVVVRQQRRADRKILTALATFPHRDNFTHELERRLAGQ